VGNKDGLFSTLADWETDVPQLPAQFDRWLDARCMNITGRPIRITLFFSQDSRLLPKQQLQAQLLD
jgi:hypothetical protein